VNASHAIKDAGTIAISTETIYANSYLSLQSGSTDNGLFTVLTITDSGKGMSKEEQAHIFEPFYTSRPRGKGVGLDLSTVYGIVKQNNGFLHVSSKLNNGTTFKSYLPASEPPSPKSRKRALTDIRSIPM